jgi:hypothetical protein
MYAGKHTKIENSEGEIEELTNEPTQPNYSPVNLFEPDYTLYPLLADVTTKYSIVLR